MPEPQPNQTPSTIEDRYGALKTEYAQIEKEYERQVRWTRFVPGFKQVFFLVWSAIDLLLIFGSLLFLVWYLVQGTFEEKKLMARIGVNLGAYREIGIERAAQGLLPSSAQIFPVSENRYDLYATVENVNTDWYAEFTYYFETPAGRTDIRHGYVLPQRSRVIAEIGAVLEARPSSAQLILEGIEWHRVSAKETDGDIAKWLEEHEAFTISDVSHGAVTQIGERDVIQTTFTLTNESPYSYWDMDIYVVLRLGRNVVGVNQIRLPAVDSGETVTQTVSWFWNASQSAQADILPQIDFFNPEVYKAL